MNTRNQREIQAHEFLKNCIKQEFIFCLNFEVMPSVVALALSDALIELGIGIRNYLRQRDQ